MIGAISGIGSAWWHRYYGKEESSLRARSPLYYADRITKPLLIIEGANDCDDHKGAKMIKAMRYPTEYLVFPDEGHVITKLSNQCKLFAAIEGFLPTHLHGRCEPLFNNDLKEQS